MQTRVSSNKGKRNKSISLMTSVNQTKEYTDALIGNHSNVVNGQLSVSGCQYLHEFELGEKNFSFRIGYSDIDISMMFVKGRGKSIC